MTSDAHALIPVGRRSPWAQAFALALGAAATEARAEPPLPLPDPAAVFATLGQASYAVDGTRGVVHQATERAILNWRQFDIGREHTLEFRQPGPDAIALNRIAPGGRPSQILGRLEANGHVYLQNPNGVLFGPTAQVDVHTLVATSLPIADAVLERGLARVIDDRRAALEGDGSRLQRDAAGQTLHDVDGQALPVVVQVMAGARLSTREPNGRILLAAPIVRNEGEIEARQGQILLVAATDRIFLQEADPETSGVRGLRVEIATGGEVTNTGRLVTPQGNSTLAGFAVNQRGRISASTSVRLNGSIRLQATEGAEVGSTIDGPVVTATRTGRAVAGADGLGVRARVVLGAESRTEVLPDPGDSSTAVDEQAQPVSRVDVIARVIDLQGQASVRVPAGRVELIATAVPRDLATESGSSADAQVHLAAGSLIDVSGLDVTVPVERNQAEVHLLSNELRDAPMQKAGPLFGQRVQIDIRTGTPLADVSGAMARVSRGLSERHSGGGSIRLRAAGSISLDAGARLDVSGGVVDYLPGFVNTTQLIAEDGRIVDIGAADPDTRYVGRLDAVTQTFERWGITRTWDISGPFGRGRFDPGYRQGAAAGSVELSAPALRLEGHIEAATRNGMHQREIGRRARSGTLVIDAARFSDANLAVTLVDDLLGEVRGALALEDHRLAQWGIGRLQIASNGDITLARGARLALGGGGHLSLTGRHIHVEGAVDAPAGRVDISSLNGDVRLAEGARIEVQGNVVNDRGGRVEGVIARDGGQVNIRAVGDLELASGSRIDVSAGAWFDVQQQAADLAQAGGRAGDINLRATRLDRAARMSLDGDLLGFGFHDGGSLTVTAPRIELHGATDAPAHIMPDGIDTALRLRPDFFLRGGFARYQIEADRDGLLVASGVNLDLAQRNLVHDAGAVTHVEAERSARAIASLTLLPAFQRLPVRLDLRVSHTAPRADLRSGLVVAAGSRIATDARGAILLGSESDITVAGELHAPAGEILLQITPPASDSFFGIELPDPGYRADQAIRVQRGGQLNANALIRPRPDPVNPLAGDLLSGGRVALHADRGYVLVEDGASLTADGASGVLAEPELTPSGAGIVFRETTLAAAAGQIDIRAAEGALVDGHLSAAARPGRGTAGGRLGLTLTTESRRADPLTLPSYPTALRRIRLGSRPSGQAQAFMVPGQSVASGFTGIAAIGLTTLRTGGFAAIDLRADDLIQLAPDIDLEVARRISLDAPALESAATDGRSRLAAAHVRLGGSLRRSADLALLPPLPGDHRLVVEAGLVDIVGALSLRGVAHTHIRSRGDLRLRGVSVGANDRRGELLTVAPLTLAADQIYPSTYSDFRIAVLAPAGARLRIEGGGDRAPVFSAGGSLLLEAPIIEQAGALRAPVGTLSLRASERLHLESGSLTSVSAEGLTIPFGRTLGGLEWVMPVGGLNPVQIAAPEKRIEIAGETLIVAHGARIDLSGGGRLQAHEFVPGPGGSVDVLDPLAPDHGPRGALNPGFAILPGLALEFAPYEETAAAAFGLAVGDSIHLDAIPGLVGGTHALLPARYALLPGAWLVRPVASAAPVVPGTRAVDPFGQSIVAGYRTVAGTPIRDARWSAFVVEPGALVRTRAEYLVSDADAFFTARAARAGVVPAERVIDGGSLLVAATRTLELAGRVHAEPGRGGAPHAWTSPRRTSSSRRRAPDLRTSARSRWPPPIWRTSASMISSSGGSVAPMPMAAPRSRCRRGPSG